MKDLLSFFFSLNYQLIIGITVSLLFSRSSDSQIDSGYHARMPLKQYIFVFVANLVFNCFS